MMSIYFYTKYTKTLMIGCSGKFCCIVISMDWQWVIMKHMCTKLMFSHHHKCATGFS